MEQGERDVVVAELLERIRRHCKSLRPWLTDMNPLTRLWQEMNQDMLLVGDSDRVRIALGDQHLDFMDVIRFESKCIVLEQNRDAEATARKAYTNAEELRYADRMEKSSRAYSLQNVADVLVTYARLILIFGDPRFSDEIRLAGEAGCARAAAIVDIAHNSH